MVIYIAAPVTMKDGDKRALRYAACPEYGLHENDISAIRSFLLSTYGYTWINDHTETEQRNHFYASGYILKRMP